MQALVLNGNLKYRTDVPKPKISADEALIRLKLAGICATDLALMNGYAEFNGIIGHEFVGVVEAVGQERHHHWLNKRVVGSINIGCQQCAVCKNQGPEHCLHRRVLGIRGHDGAFADYFTLPISNLYTVPDEVSDESAVFTEPLAAAIRVVRQLENIPFNQLAVIGPGRLGLLIAQVLSLAPYDVMVLGRSERSLVLPRQWGLKTALIRDIPDKNFDCVVDACGQAEGFSQAVRITKPGGILVLKSTLAACDAVDLSKVVVNEITLLGSRCGPFANALDTLKQQTVPIESMIDGCYELKDGLKAIAHAAKPGVRKILLRP